MTELFGSTRRSCATRRAALRERLESTAALIPAGRPIGRNYAGNAYPFRASSHFLYLVGDLGQGLPGTYLLIDGEGETLFAHAPTAEDALWHGASPALPQLAEMLGLKVRDLDELADALKGRSLATVAGPDAATRSHQAELLGRPLDGSADDAASADATLAEALIALRLVHDEDAIASLQVAAQATAFAHAAGMAITRPGLREWEIKAAMEQAMSSLGMTTAYPPIVTTHGEVLHNNTYSRTLAQGDLVLADVGAETLGGWAGDVTRTWPVSGSYSTPQRELYEAVLASQKAAIEAVKPGTRYRDVHLLASTVLAQGLVDLGILRGDPAELVADDVHALFFPHGVGHLIGLDVHDMEDLGDRAGYAPGRERSERFGLCYLRLDRDLVEGMAVTIEPGFYQVPAILQDEVRLASAKGRLDQDRLAAFSDVRGIRIEDDVLVTKTGHQVLTAAIPKEVAAVEAAIGAQR